MGGSSLCPEVLRMTFGKIDGFPELHVLDSTDPAQVKAFESKVDLANTLFIVSSKSGSTLEPNIFKQYFFDRVQQVVGREGGRQPLHRHHRSRLEAAAGRRARRLPARLLRLAEHRRALLGALGLRPGAGRDHGRRRAEVPGSHRGDGPRLRAVGAGRREPGRRARERSSASPPTSSAATRSRSSPRRASPTSAPGWSSWSPSPPARTARD